ncbi:MAG TPA: transglutaminase-like domain-containing protein [Candidatus Omnitrophota bacterium]|nr:transglutaminase-like domain-containing protein [Candidatus Omnitrophota bacterium]
MPKSPGDHRDRLAALGGAGDDAVGLGETGFLLAGLCRPQARVADYLDYRDGLAAELAPAPSDAAGRAATLAELMAGRQRFRGDDCDDEQVANANLMWVVDHRQGVRSALAILYLDVARAAGWRADGLNLPGALLVRLEDGAGQRVILDPFERGRIVGAPDLRALVKSSSGSAAELEPAYFTPAGNRDMLVRLQNDIKLRLLRRGLVERALAVVEAVLLFAPGQAQLWRECGLMQLRLGDPRAAAASLEQFVARTANPGARRRTLQLLQDIRLRLL